PTPTVRLRLRRHCRPDPHHRSSPLVSIHALGRAAQRRTLSGFGQRRARTDAVAGRVFAREAQDVVRLPGYVMDACTSSLLNIRNSSGWVQQFYDWIAAMNT